jgi:hypothetical protein
MTLSLVRIRLGTAEKPTGLSYVALSRARRLEDILLDYANFGASRLTNIRLPEYAVKADVDTLLLIKSTHQEYKYKGG